MPPTPTSRLLTETGAHWDILRQHLEDAPVKEPMVHDARIGALCRGHGVTEIWTANRDFSRFLALATRNALQG